MFKQAALRQLHTCVWQVALWQSVHQLPTNLKVKAKGSWLSLPYYNSYAKCQERGGCAGRCFLYVGEGDGDGYGDGDGDGDEWRTRGFRGFVDKDRKNPGLKEFTMRHRTQVNGRTAVSRLTTNQTLLCAYNYVDMSLEVNYIFLRFAVAKWEVELFSTFLHLY